PVLNRLDHLVETRNLTQLVTVVYGVLDPPAGDGSRRFTFSNAGHLAPLLRAPDGSVEQLAGGDSVLIGAPIDVEHQQVEQILAPGSTLVLFTDGLIEVPGQPLEEKLDQLTATLRQHDPDAGLDAMCEEVLAGTATQTLRDDVALLAIRIADNRRSLPGPSRAPEADSREMA
ncbi:MAG: serine/threonine-protein phosphatase, partial [Frankiales bacterium]|nr:serine/threonine-protein phosphatase [Frankiales bacterium]